MHNTEKRETITPRPGGYVDATMTNIYRAKIPSHMYIKYQCR